jgi:hypothetical protein
MKTLLTTLSLTIAVLLGSVGESFALPKCERSPTLHDGSTCLFKTQTSPSQKEVPEKMIEEGMRMILSAIELILQSIPEYKAPEILENGDIIIRRAQPNEKSSDAEDESKKGI